MSALTSEYGRITLSNGYCHFVDDVKNNMEFLARFAPADRNETYRVAATRQMEQLSSSITSDKFFNHL